MKKLLIVSTNTIHVFNYINLIRDYFDEIHLITNTKEENFNYGTIKISYTEFSLRKPFAFYKSIGFIRNIIISDKPTIIHVQQLTTNALLTILANKNIKKPAVYTAWGSDVLLNSKSGFLLKKMIHYILKNAKHFTSDSRHMAEIMNQIAGKKLDILIANFGININNSVKIEKQNFIYSNRQLKSLYRIDKIIEGFAKLIEQGNPENWKLVIGAVGEERQSLIELTQKLSIESHVEFVGWLEKEQNSYYYNISKYYISIPESDATSISLLEAMAAGCIPILSDLPANREWIKDGENGLIVADLNSNYIKDALKIYVENAIKINREIIADHGTKEANRAKFIAFYEQILSQQV